MMFKTLAKIFLCLFAISGILTSLFSLTRTINPLPTYATSHCAITVPSLPIESGQSIRVMVSTTLNQGTVSINLDRETQENVGGVFITIWAPVTTAYADMTRSTRASLLFDGSMFPPGTYRFTANFPNFYKVGSPSEPCTSPAPFTLTSPSSTNCILRYTGIDILPNITFKRTQHFEITNVNPSKAYIVQVYDSQNNLTYTSVAKQGNGPLQFDPPPSAFPEWGGAYTIKGVAVSGALAGSVPPPLLISSNGSPCDNPITVTVTEGQPPPVLVSGENPCDTYPPPNGDGKITKEDTCPTALGDLKPELGPFAQKILTIGASLAGAIALIIMVIGAIRVLTSGGDPKNVAAGREMIIAAVAGLLFLIFSFLILRFIGVDIIGLP